MQLPDAPAASPDHDQQPLPLRLELWCKPSSRMHHHHLSATSVSTGPQAPPPGSRLEVLVAECPVLLLPPASRAACHELRQHLGQLGGLHPRHPHASAAKKHSSSRPAAATAAAATAPPQPLQLSAQRAAWDLRAASPALEEASSEGEIMSSCCDLAWDEGLGEPHGLSLPLHALAPSHDEAGGRPASDGARLAAEGASSPSAAAVGSAQRGGGKGGAWYLMEDLSALLSLVPSGDEEAAAAWERRAREARRVGVSVLQHAVRHGLQALASVVVAALQRAEQGGGGGGFGAAGRGASEWWEAAVGGGDGGGGAEGVRSSLLHAAMVCGDAAMLELVLR